jgi:hypothetical protein
MTTFRGQVSPVILTKYFMNLDTGKFKVLFWIKYKLQRKNYNYSERRLMLLPVNVIIRLMRSLFMVPFTNAD